jgi:hypothetical protein
VSEFAEVKFALVFKKLHTYDLKVFKYESFLQGQYITPPKFLFSVVLSQFCMYGMRIKSMRGRGSLSRTFDTKQFLNNPVLAPKNIFGFQVQN